MKKEKLLTLVGSICLVLVLVALLIPGCAKEEAPVAPPPAPPPVVKPPVEKPPVKPVKPIVWKASNYLHPTGPAAALTSYLFDGLEERSDGRFRCNIFWAQSLCPAREEPDGLKSGLFQATYFASAYYPTKLPLYSITYLPCLFPFTQGPKEEWYTYINLSNEWLETTPLKEEFAEWDGLLVSEFVPLYYSLMGNAHITNIEDLKGRKIRATGGVSKLLTKAGAAPVFCSSPEIYDALSKGVVEEITALFPAFCPYKHYEMSKYWTLGVTLGHAPFASVVSKTAYEALPKDLQGVFQEWFQEFRKDSPDVMWPIRLACLEDIDKTELEILQFAKGDNEKLRELAKEIWEEKMGWLEERDLPGREVFNSLQDIIKKHVPGYEPYHL